MKNEGKIFEQCFERSIDTEHNLVKRLNDSPAGMFSSGSIRFAPNNECDYLIYNDELRIILGLELKTTEHTSFTFWRKDFEIAGKKTGFMIRKCQILGLEKWSKYNGVFGFVFNFRNGENNTYFVNIKDFIAYTSSLEKKSVNEKDILEMNPVIIENKKIKTRYKYNIGKFISDIANVA